MSGGVTATVPGEGVDLGGSAAAALLVEVARKTSAAVSWSLAVGTAAGGSSATSSGIGAMYCLRTFLSWGRRMGLERK
jgi:hypothetical protein